MYDSTEADSSSDMSFTSWFRMTHIIPPLKCFKRVRSDALRTMWVNEKETCIEMLTEEKLYKKINARGESQRRT